MEIIWSNFQGTCEEKYRKYRLVDLFNPFTQDFVLQSKFELVLLKILYETYQDQEHVEYYIRNKSIIVKGLVLLTWIDGHIDVS